MVPLYHVAYTHIKVLSAVSLVSRIMRYTHGNTPSAKPCKNIANAASDPSQYGYYESGYYGQAKTQCGTPICMLYWAKDSGNSTYASSISKRSMRMSSDSSVGSWR